jgi:hypothetical protein
MGRRRVLAACLLLLAAVLLLLVANARRADLAAPAPEQTDRPVAAAETASSSTDASPLRRSAAVELDDAADIDARESADAPHRLAITVVWPDGKPVPNAEVRYWPPRSAAQRRADEATVAATRDVEAALRATGRSVEADADGRAELTVDAEGWICARSGDDYGELEVERAGTEHSWLVLRRDLSLRVQVVDDRGQPCAGITVGAQYAFLQRTSGFQTANTVELPPTDEQGLACWAHVQVHAPLPDVDVVEWSLQLWCRGNHLSTSRRAVTAEELQSALPIRLTVPSGGDVTVEVVDAAGEPCFWTPILVDDERGTDCSPTQSPKPGLYCFRQVPLGRRWRIVVVVERVGITKSRSKTADEILSQDLIGPVRVDEPVRARFVVPRLDWFLTARLRRADGREFRCRRVSFQAIAVGADNALVGIDGVSRHDRGPVTELRLRLQTPVAERLADATLHVECNLPRGDFDIPVPDIHNRRQDLGDLVLPAPEDEMDLAIVEVRNAGANVTAAAHVSLYEQVGDKQQQVPTTGQLDGAAMVLRGARPASDLWLWCSHAEALSAEQRIEPGAHVVVELQAAARLSVRFAYGTAPDQLVSGRLESLDDPDARPIAHTYFVESVMHWESVRPGRYRLVVALDDRDVFAQDLPPLAAGRNYWPTGAPLDLRSHVRVLYANVCDPAGQAVEDFHWSVVPAGAQAGPVSEHSSRSHWVIVETAPRDVLFMSPGCVPVRVSQPTRDFRVTLAPCTVLQVQAATAATEVAIEYLDDGIADPLLRALDREFSRRPDSLELDPVVPAELALPPGARLLLRTVRDGVRGPPETVVVGAAGPQLVVVR